MPPQIALLLCIFFILYLLWVDSKRESKVSGALWIPLIWLMIAGSRPVALWFNVGPVLETEMDILGGNPIDRTIFIILIVIGILILARRGIYCSLVLKSNVWIILMLMYAGISILWSDFPLVSFKRWIKEIGNLIMILIVLTDTDPLEAISTLLRRCAYVLITLSIVLIKYFPELGRAYGPWTGEVEFRGVTTSKNMLGILCLVFGLFFFWSLFTIRNKKKEVFVNIFFLAMIFWLLIGAKSATSLMCLFVGIFVIITTGLPILKRNVQHIGVFIFVSVVLFALLQMSLNIGELAVFTLGRDATLTGRTHLWAQVLDMVTNPLIGVGYDSFWLGDRMTKLWEKFWWHPNQAHNGYIEIYLNLGLIGIFLLLGVIWSSYKHARRTIMFDFDYGRWQLAFLIITLLISVTEAVLKGISILWFIFLLNAMYVSHMLQPQIQVSSEVY